MGCFGACLPAAREPQLESGRAASRHRRCCREMYSESHGAGAGSTGCRIRKTYIWVRERWSGEQCQTSGYLMH
jgi:hypothetical protein